jgi:hypothetical protein
MPTRDGFSTNPEMIADFTETSRQVFVETFNMEAENGLHQAFIGKPLSMMTLEVQTLYSPESGTKLESERLYIDPLQDGHINSLKFSNRPPEGSIIELRRQQASAVGAVILSPSTTIESVLRPGHVASDYRAGFVDGRTKQVDTFKERPAKIVIASALNYAEGYLEHLRGGIDANKDNLTTILQMANRRLEYGKRVLAKDTWAQFDFRITPELPLNGNESTGFLRRYHGQMRESVMRREEQLRRLTILGGPMVEQAEATISRFSDAKACAKRFLEERGEEA